MKTTSDLIIREDGLLEFEFSAPTVRYFLTPDEAKAFAAQLSAAADRARPPENVIHFRRPDA